VAASHPEDAERVRANAEQNAVLRSLYNPVLDEPVPAALLAVRPRALAGLRGGCGDIRARDSGWAGPLAGR